MRLFPRNDRYHDLFESAADELTAVATSFAELAEAEDTDRLSLAERLADPDPDPGNGDGDGDGSSDLVAPGVIGELERAFVTPFDREDILALAFELDDAVATLRQAADLMALHQATEPPDGFAELGHLIAKAAETTASGVRGLRQLKSISFGDLSITLDGLAREGRGLVRGMLAELFRFEGEHPARRVLQWRSVLDEIDLALRHLSATGRILETTVVKYS